MQIGVVIAARNAAPWIADAVSSVRGQVYRDWHLAVVDDGSDDATGERAMREAAGDERVTLIRQRAAGVSAARNRGAAAVAGCAAVLFLDADDWLAQHALLRLTQRLVSAPGCVAAAGSAAFVREQDLPGAWPQRLLHPQSGDLLEPLLVRNLFANCGQLLIRTQALAGAGLFRPGLSYGEDWEFLVRLALQGRFATVDAAEMPVLFVRRRAEGAFLGQAGRQLASAACMQAIFTEPGVRARFTAERLATIRALAETENVWNSGRALLAQGRRLEGVARLAHALMRRPSCRRAVFALAAALLPRLRAIA